MMTGSNIGTLNAPRRSMACSIIRRAETSAPAGDAPPASAASSASSSSASIFRSVIAMTISFLVLELAVHAPPSSRHGVGDHLQ